MSRFCLLPVLILVSFWAGAQPQLFQITQGCAYDEDQLGNEVYLFDASNEADRIVAEIVDALGLQKNFTVKSSSVKNALATTDKGQRYILYSTTFLEKFKADAATRWAAYSVLAHEIGHHLNGHDFSEADTRKRKLLELEADQFSGSVLRMLGAALSEAQAGIETFGLEGESSTHPAKFARREAIASGWKTRDEWLRDRGMADELPKSLEEAGVPSTGPVPDLGSNIVRDELEPCSGCPEMILVQGGRFAMGCDDKQGEACKAATQPAHLVSVRNFYIGKTEVTQAQWQAIMGANPSRFSNCSRCPVESVTYEEVQAFIQRLNAQTGNRYRLPTEAEWEFAARGGNSTGRNLYAGHSKVLGQVAWYAGNSGRKTHPVKDRRSNELGIYDMSGNVQEWCADLWHDNYEGAPDNGNTWKTGGASGFGVVRGGAFDELNEAAFRTYARKKAAVDRRYENVGFRLAHD
ncbi:MAG: hypothetical protein EP344_10145 [Bacteroidetes bacterium]|nr:MAG: hypothetical protein EP344_10145 [Bacteroidota bacterium]